MSFYIKVKTLCAIRLKHNIIASLERFDYIGKKHKMVIVKAPQKASCFV